jgi:type I restriction enzyme, S subunit
MLTTFEVPSRELGQSWTVPRYRTRHMRKNEQIAWRPLSEVAEIGSGMYLKDYSASGVPYIRVDNVRRFFLSMASNDIAFIEPAKAKRVPDRCAIATNDVVISRTGTLGKAAIVSARAAGSVMSQHISRLRVRDLKILRPGFLCCYLNSQRGRQALIDGGAGSTRLELTHESLGSLLVPMLRLEQQIIWETRALTAVMAYETAADRLRSLVVAADSLLFSNEDQDQLPSHTRIFETFSVKSAGVREMWNIGAHRPDGGGLLETAERRFVFVPLGSLAKIERGKGVTVSQYATSGIPFIRTSSLIDGVYDPLPDHFASPETYREFDQDVLDGDILYSMEGRIGEVSLLFSDFPVVFKNHIQRIRVEEGYPNSGNQAFLGWLYLTLRGCMGRLQADQFSVVQSTIPGLGGRLREFLVPVRANEADDHARMLALGETAYIAAKSCAAAGDELRAIYAEFESLTN